MVIDVFKLSCREFFENEGNLYSACSNFTNVVLVIFLVIAFVITHQSSLALPISSILAYYHTQDNISGIRTRAIKITFIFKIHFVWKKAMRHCVPVRLRSIIG
jgi:hypothetical protein